MSKYEFEPIGFIRSDARYPQESPRQGVLARRSGIIELEKKRNFETAAADLAGVDRIWIIFVFHLVNGWKTKVRPPLGGFSQKIGVFATRSPHRPNPIGITAARLDGINGLKLAVSEIDLLDGTPVLDIKPYIPMADSFPDARTGWRDQAERELYPVTPEPDALKTAECILSHGGPDIIEFCRIQLGTRDIDPGRLRLSGPDQQGVFTLAFRTWRIDFISENNQIKLLNIYSGYTASELLPGADDPYLDKELHRLVKEAVSSL